MSLMSISRFARLATPHLTFTPRTCPISVKTAQYFESLRTQPVLKRSFCAKPENDNVVVSKEALLRMEIRLSDFPALQDDFKSVLSIVNNNGLQLDHASERLKNNPVIVMAAVSNNGWALKYASPELQNNDEIVLKAVLKHGYAIQYASPEKRNDVKLAKIAVTEYGLYIMKYIGPDAQKALWDYAEEISSNIYRR